MKFFTCDKIKAADAYTIANEPISSVDLMERAAEQLANWIHNRFPSETQFIIFAGPGNNGGDGWALARILSKQGYSKISVYLLQINDLLSPDSEINRERLFSESKVVVRNIKSSSDFPAIDKNDYIIDALFGSGLTRPLVDLPAKLVQFINQSQKKGLLAIDIPSGLLGEDNSGNIPDNIIKASYTLSFQFPKLSFFFAENAKYVGEWHALPIGLHRSFIENETTQFNYIEEEGVIGRLKVRDKFSHKGTYGHALLIAGSYGMMGAAVLSARAAIRAGAGLVTSHVPSCGVDILQNSIPESLLSFDHSEEFFTEFPSPEKYSAIGIGPGLGKNLKSCEALIQLLGKCKVPMVIDADALNILAGSETWQDIIPEGCILTPHPKEFERLFGKFPNSYLRLMTQINFSHEKKCTIILKGAHTCITSSEGNVWFNTTGNPGMATGGSGDVLTGLVLGLVAQGYCASDASILATYIHGFAGDLAAKKKGMHGLIASDIVDNIGPVFSVLENKKPST